MKESTSHFLIYMITAQTPNTKIRLIAAYFGTLPAYFPIWLRSCAANPTVDWLFLTDTMTSELPKLPANVTAITISIADLKTMFSKKLHLAVCLDSPYKLCDFRPAFGFVFEDWLRDYEFWGYCDVDVVWGDLKTFFTNELFSKYDKIQESGHLTFCRNSPELNKVFMTPVPHIDYRTVFTSPRSFAFDEWGGMHDLAYVAGIRRVWLRNMMDADWLSFKLRAVGGTNYPNQIFYWQDGHLYRDYIANTGSKNEDFESPTVRTDEFSYFHFQKRVMPAPVFDVNDVRGFYITPAGFVQKLKDEHCRADFSRFNGSRPTYHLLRRGKRAFSRSLLGVRTLM